MAGPFIQQDGKVYIGTAAVAATMLVTSANQIARINGEVALDLTWQFASARWRTRAIQDHDAFAIDGSITAEEVEWVASNIARLMTGDTVSTIPLYGQVAASFASANLWKITTSTVPQNMQWVFVFTRSDDNKEMQIYSPKAKVENYPAPFAVEDYTKQALTWRLLASTNGKFIEVLHGVSTAGRGAG